MTTRKEAAMPKRSTKQSEPAELKRVIFGKGAPRPHEIHQEIERRAYELYLQRGGGDGRAEEDWFQAERELRGEQSQAQ